MKYYIQKNKIIWLKYVIIITSMLMVFSGCITEPYYYLEIENQTEQELTIYVGYKDTNGEVVFRSNRGTVEPGQQIKIQFSRNQSRIPIRALSKQGEIVFSQEFTSENTIEINNKTYKAIIPPFGNKTEASNNATSE